MKKSTSMVVNRRCDEDWEWFKASSGVPYEITGKYLYFSPDREYLCNIALTEIRRHDFHKAKINLHLEGANTDHILCLYYRDDSRKYELKDRAVAEYPNARYRWWKSDADTLAGKYSKEFLGKLSPDRRREFQKDEK